VEANRVEPDRALIRRRWLVWGIVVTMLVSYLGFCFAPVYAPDALGPPLSDENALARGFYIAFTLAWFYVAMALYYVYISNKQDDEHGAADSGSAD